MKNNNIAYRLTIEPDFIPCEVCDNDEIFRNGIFQFNITKLLSDVKNKTIDVSVGEFELKQHVTSFSKLNEAHLANVDLTKPIIAAEISPKRYVIIDGNHRAAKAKKQRLTSLPVIKLPPLQHIRYIIDKEAYLAYVEYWNSKL